MYYFASDVHLGAGDDASARQHERRFIEWLDKAAQDAEAIFLVGDVFDFWFEYRRVVPKGFVRTLGRLAALTDRGVRVVFFTGNHDMWVGDYLSRECGVEIYTSPQVMLLAGKPVFIAHGDNMNIDNLPMLKLLNRVFRSRTLRWLFSWGVHPDWAMRFGAWWSGRSRKKHASGEGFDASLNDPLDNFAREYARRNDVHDFIFGHMHYACEVCEQGLHVVHLGGWERHPSYATLDKEGLWTLNMLER